MVRLTQKSFLKGTRNFEIIDDTLYVRIKSFFRESTLSVGLSTLNPKPVVNGSEMVFYSSANNQPMLSLFINKPNAEEFTAYIELLQRVIEKYNPNTGSAVTDNSQPELGDNVYDEPPVFDDDEGTNKVAFTPVSVERISNDITMLKTYLDEDDIKPLLDSLQALEAEPASEAAFDKMIDAYKELGFNQGAVLTYAPYLKVLLSKSLSKSII